jgi:NADPH:quinone reductase
VRVALAQQLGGIGSVKPGELPDPVPAAGQALVRVHGAGVGPWDVGFLGGGFPGIALPFVPGQEVAGVVEAASPLTCDNAISAGRRAFSRPFRHSTCRFDRSWRGSAADADRPIGVLRAGGGRRGMAAR